LDYVYWLLHSLDSKEAIPVRQISSRLLNLVGVVFPPSRLKSDITGTLIVEHLHRGKVGRCVVVSEEASVTERD
jgi:hypothetical protein